MGEGLDKELYDGNEQLRWNAALLHVYLHFKASKKTQGQRSAIIRWVRVFKEQILFTSQGVTP